MLLDICCIARREEMTIVDWVEYHRQIGVNHIYIFDNNDSDDFSLNKLLKYYTDNGFVTIFPTYKGMKAKQMESYNTAIKEIKKYEINNWTAFIDCDEYLSLGSKYQSFSELLEELEKKCPNIGVLYVNWVCYTANKKIFYEPYPVVERFTERLTTNQGINTHIKSIIKNSCMAEFGCPHNAMPSDGHKIYNMDFKEVACSPFQEFKEGYPLYLNHYVTKSIQEYLYRKYGQGTADSLDANYYNFDFFLNHNNQDKEYYEQPFNDMIKLLDK